MGQTLFLCGISLLASQSSTGQAYDRVGPYGNPCPGCQAAAAAQMEAQVQQGTPARGGPLGLGIWDKLRGRSASDNFPPSEPQPNIFTRMQMRVNGWFGWNSRPTPVEYGDSMVEHQGGPPFMTNYSTAEPPLNGSVVPISYVPGQQGGQPMVRTGVSEINAKFVNMIGHEEDYSWITGQLAIRGGQAYILYATPETIDKFGGKLQLTNITDMSSLRSGDLISVTGSLMSQNGGVFRVQNIGRIQSGQHEK